MNRSESIGWRYVFSDRRGVAAIEFALTLPAMIALAAGIAEFSSTMQTFKKNKLAAYTVTDLVSRCRTVNANDITDDFVAAALIMSGTKTLPTTISARVGSVKFATTTGTASIDWSKGIGNAPPSEATILSKATGKATAGNSLIVTVIDYSYTPVGQLVPAITMQDIAFASPRLVPNVTLTGACDWSL